VTAVGVGRGGSSACRRRRGAELPPARR